jgi:hypothetical protein
MTRQICKQRAGNPIAQRQQPDSRVLAADCSGDVGRSDPGEALFENAWLLARNTELERDNQALRGELHAVLQANAELCLRCERAETALDRLQRLADGW